jgi:hypothetical protein
MATFKYQVGDKVVVDELQTNKAKYTPCINIPGKIRFQNLFGIGPRKIAKGRWFEGLVVGTPWYVVELPFGEFEDVPEQHLSVVDAEQLTSLIQAL